MNCPNCGRDVGNSLRFCGYCGAPLAEVKTDVHRYPAENPAGGAPKRKITAAALMIALPIAVLLILCVFAVWRTHAPEKPGPQPEPGQGQERDAGSSGAAPAPSAEPSPGPETKPAAEPSPGPETKPAAEPSPGSGTKPAAEPSPEAETKPAAEPSPEAETKPAAEPAQEPESGEDSTGGMMYDVSQPFQGKYTIRIRRSDVWKEKGWTEARADILSYYIYSPGEMAALEPGTACSAAHGETVESIDRSDDVITVHTAQRDYTFLLRDDGDWIETYSSGTPVSYVTDSAFLVFAKTCEYRDQLSSVLEGAGEPYRRNSLDELFDAAGTDEIRLMDIRIEEGYVTRAFMWYLP